MQFSLSKFPQFLQQEPVLAIAVCCNPITKRNHEKYLLCVCGDAIVSAADFQHTCKCSEQQVGRGAETGCFEQKRRAQRSALKSVALIQQTQGNF